MATSSLESVRVLVERLLEGHRSETLTNLVVQQLTVTEQEFVRQWSQPVHHAAGLWLASSPLDSVIKLLLKWGISQIRPDKALTLILEDDQQWLELRRWRPVIALMCHYGFVPVPNFPARYYRHPNEAVIDNLCGIWEIGHSTFYRYLDKAKEHLTRLLYEQARDGRYTASLQAFTIEEIYAAERLKTHTSRKAWHCEQARYYQHAANYLAAIWHLRMAGEFAQINQLIIHHALKIASEPGSKREIEALQNESMKQQDKIHLYLALADIYRAWHDEEGELIAYETAAKLAANPEDKAGLAVIYSYMGKYYEGRDSDRALAYYQDSLDFFAEVGLEKEEHIRAHVRLAWLYALRNDPRARDLLEKASLFSLSATSLIKAELEKAWGEYWRREGQTQSELEKSVEHTQRALNIYKLLDNNRGIITSYLNLGLVYSELRRFDQAIGCYTQIHKVGRETAVDSGLLASTYLNLGVCYFWQGNYDAAIHEYQCGLQKSQEAGLTLHAGRSHYNLAEAYYMKYLDSQNPIEEQQGDDHIAAAMDIFQDGGFQTELESTRRLKKDLFTGTKQDIEQKMLPQEKAIHLLEIAAIEKNRALITNTPNPEEHIRAHLAIAKAYLTISIREKEQAQQLCQKHQLENRFDAEFEEMQQIFACSLTTKERLFQTWHVRLHIDEHYLRQALDYLLEKGEITKRVYITLCHVSPATASNHLGQMVKAELLQRVGQGRSTRYILNDTVYA